MVRLESKDLLLARVWHTYRAYPIKACMLGVRCLWSRGRVSLAELLLLSLCLDVVLQVCSLSPS
jgi:hypothetical protein